MIIEILNRNMIRSITKPTKWPVRPAKTQINLSIRPVWTESLLPAWRKPGSLATNWVHSEYSDQTGQMLRQIWVFGGHTGHFVSFVMLRLIYANKRDKNCIETLQNDFFSDSWFRFYWLNELWRYVNRNSLYGPRQANLCLQAFRHDKF